MSTAIILACVVIFSLFAGLISVVAFENYLARRDKEIQKNFDAELKKSEKNG